MYLKNLIPRGNVTVLKVIHFSTHALCGSFSPSGAAADVSKCADFDLVFRDNFPSIECKSRSKESFLFDRTETLKTQEDLFMAQSLWALLLLNPEHKTIFVDDSVKDLSELDRTAQKLKTSLTGYPLRCQGALDLRSYPADTFWEHASLSYPGSGSKWVFQVKNTTKHMWHFFKIWLLTYS